MSGISRRKRESHSRVGVRPRVSKKDTIFRRIENQRRGGERTTALPEIMVAGGWRSPQMPAHYARKLDAKHGAMRRWIR
jgi:hypothetical protein